MISIKTGKKYTREESLKWSRESDKDIPSVLASVRYLESYGYFIAICFIHFVLGITTTVFLVYIAWWLIFPCLILDSLDIYNLYLAYKEID